MKKRRIFIVVNLPDKLKKTLVEYKNKWPEIPARWTAPENLHITLVFLGYLNNEELVEVCFAVKEVVKKHQPLLINFNKIVYGPVDQPLSKIRMIWAMGETSKELQTIKKELENLLVEKINFKTENRGFTNHITLARLRQFEFRAMEEDEIPEISENIDLSFLVESIEIMESKLRREGAKYSVLESVRLG